MRKVSFAQNEYYHIYNRGTDKRIIFEDKEDYQRFLVCLYLSNNKSSFNLNDLIKRGKTYRDMFLIDQDPIVSIYAYILMPNHFHLLLSEHVDGGASLFMQKLTTAYTMYFNRKKERTGGLLQGTFKSRHVNTDIYLRYLFAYIHANPFSIEKSGSATIKNAEKVLAYEYSSIKDYLGIKRPETSILDMAFFMKEFGGKTSILKQLSAWLDYHGDEVRESLSRGLTSRQKKNKI